MVRWNMELSSRFIKENFYCVIWVKMRKSGKKFPGDDHSEKSWGKRLYIPFEFLLRKEK